MKNTNFAQMVYYVPRAIESESLLACSPDMSGPGGNDLLSGTIFQG